VSRTAIAVCAVLVALLGGVSGVSWAGTAVTSTASGTVAANDTGARIGGACVSAWTSATTKVASTCADAQGSFSLAVPVNADGTTTYYRFLATAPGYADSWADGRSDYGNAASYALSAGSARPTFAFQLHRGAGTIAGVITDYTGDPFPGATVEVYPVNSNFTAHAISGPDGSYSLTNLQPGDYRVSVRGPGHIIQFVPQRLTIQSAGIVTVVDQRTTTVNEQLLPPGTVQIKLVDSVTGAPVSSACVQLSAPLISQPSRCGSSDGTYTYTDVPQGNWRVGASSHYYWAAASAAVVTGNATTTLTLKLAPAAAIRTTVVSSTDPSAHPGVCVSTTRVLLPGLIAPDTDCSGPDGSLVIGPLPQTTLQVFARPSDPAYGSQWVGANGGTGDQQLAANITTRTGTTVSMPSIRLDPAGSISGTVTAQNSGAPVSAACVSPVAIQITGDTPIIFPAPGGCADSNGHYMLTGLGPYAWPLQFRDQSALYAEQWSGGAATRLDAVPVVVRAGKNTTADARLTPAGSIALYLNIGVVPAPAFVSVWAVNAITGDLAGAVTSTTPGSGWRITGLGTEPVQIFYFPYSASTQGAVCSLRGAVAATAGRMVQATLPFINATTCGTPPLPPPPSTPRPPGQTPVPPPQPGRHPLP
jgi:hypothetical protein